MTNYNERLGEILDEYENGQNPLQSEDYRIDRAKQALTSLINQQVIQALETLRNKAEGGYTVKQLEKHSPLGVVAKPVVPLSVIDNLIKEYKGEEYENI